LHRSEQKGRCGLPVQSVGLLQVGQRTDSGIAISENATSCRTRQGKFFATSASFFTSFAGPGSLPSERFFRRRKTIAMYGSR
jgi:hypothetical protein